MGPLWEIVALTGHRAVHLPDACRVKDADIKGDGAIGEIHGQRFQASLEERSAGVIVGQIDPVERDVPRCHCRLRPGPASRAG